MNFEIGSVQREHIEGLSEKTGNANQHSEFFCFVFLILQFPSLSDVLGGPRLRTNLPVQLVLPQVHPRTTTTSSTTATTTAVAPASRTPVCANSPPDIITDTKRALRAISDTVAAHPAQPPTLTPDANALSVTSPPEIESLTLTLPCGAGAGVGDGAQSGTVSSAPRVVPGLVPVHQGSGRVAGDSGSRGGEEGARATVAMEITSQPSLRGVAGELM